MTPDDNSWVATKITDLLTVLETAFAGDPFVRYIVSPGAAAWDCEQLAIWTTGTKHVGIGTSQTSSTQPISVAGVHNAIVVNVEAIRCVTTFEDNDIPSAATITSEGVRMETDKWIAWRTITRGCVDGSIFGGCTSTYLRPQQPLDPAGGYAGFRTIIEVTI